MASPLLPWEVIERVIGHSGDHPRTLRSLSLTCHALRPRALCLLVSDVHFQRRNRIFEFCDFLQANTHLQPFVQSITVVPAEFAPFPLLSILPNLQTLIFSPTRRSSNLLEDRVTTVLNRPSLTCCERFSSHIQALHLYDLSFATYVDFARILLAFSNLAELICYRVIIVSEGNLLHLDVLERHLSERLHLRTVKIYYFELKQDKFWDKSSVAALLLDSEPGLVRSTVEAITVEPYRSHGLSHMFEWPRLRSLVLRTRFATEDIAAAIIFLKDLPHSMKDIRVVLLDRYSVWNFNDLSRVHAGSWQQQLKELEQALLRFPRPGIKFLFSTLRDDRDTFWTEEIGKHVPELSQRKAFTVTSGKFVVLGAGHDGRVSDIATSPDSKWVATSSEDSTIILWNTTDGAVAHQWVAHSYNEVTSLAFSPDSRYLLSGGRDSRLKIWNVVREGSREVAALEGHTKDVTCCAWSPRGDIVASGSKDQSVWLWDAHTFHALHVLEVHPDLSSICLLTFSPDGRWLACKAERGYHLWNTASGSLHKSLMDSALSLLRCPGPAAVFDPESVYLLVADSSHMSKIVDVETGEERDVLRGWNGASSVSFSPDGTLVILTSSDGRMLLLDSHTGVELSWLHGHKKQIRQACFSPCGRFVATGSDDSTVRLWRTGDGSCIETFYNYGEEILVVAFSPDGETLWCGDYRGTVIMRRMRDVIPTEERAW